MGVKPATRKLRKIPTKFDTAILAHKRMDWDDPINKINIAIADATNKKLKAAQIKSLLDNYSAGKLTYQQAKDQFKAKRFDEDPKVREVLKTKLHADYLDGKIRLSDLEEQLKDIGEFKPAEVAHIAQFVNTAEKAVNTGNPDELVKFVNARGAMNQVRRNELLRTYAMLLVGEKSAVANEVEKLNKQVDATEDKIRQMEKDTAVKYRAVLDSAKKDLIDEVLRERAKIEEQRNKELAKARADADNLAEQAKLRYEKSITAIKQLLSASYKDKAGTEAYNKAVAPDGIATKKALEMYEKITGKTASTLKEATDDTSLTPTQIGEIKAELTSVALNAKADAEASFVLSPAEEKIVAEELAKNKDAVDALKKYKDEVEQIEKDVSALSSKIASKYQADWVKAGKKQSEIDKLAIAKAQAETKADDDEIMKLRKDITALLNLLSKNRDALEKEIATEVAKVGTEVVGKDAKTGADILLSSAEDLLMKKIEEKSKTVDIGKVERAMKGRQRGKGLGANNVGNISSQSDVDVMGGIANSYGPDPSENVDEKAGKTGRKNKPIADKKLVEAAFLAAESGNVSLAFSLLDAGASGLSKAKYVDSWNYINQFQSAGGGN